MKNEAPALNKSLLENRKPKLINTVPIKVNQNWNFEATTGTISANIGTFCFPTSGEKYSNQTKNGTILYKCPIIKNEKKPIKNNHPLQSKNSWYPVVKYNIAHIIDINSAPNDTNRFWTYISFSFLALVL